MADPIGGWRRVADHGNMGLNTGWKFIPAQPGMYAIKVQAVDGGYMIWLESGKTCLCRCTNGTFSLVLAHQSGKARRVGSTTAITPVLVIERRLNGGAFQKVDSVSYDDIELCGILQRF